MSGPELRMNVYNSSKIGHANVSFYRDGEHQYTIGANIRLEVPQLALPRVLPFEPDDGIYRDESAFHLSAIAEGTITSAAVPITEIQYDTLLNVARSLENETFNYSVFTDACIELVEDFYDASGHPGEFGDLFAADDRSGSLVWSRVPVSDDNPFSTWPDDKPLYEPPDPIIPDPPGFPDPVVFFGIPDPPPFSSASIPTTPEVAPSNQETLGSIEKEFASDDISIGNNGDNVGDPPAYEFQLENFPSQKLSFGERFGPVDQWENSETGAEIHTPVGSEAGSPFSPLEPSELVLGFPDRLSNGSEVGRAHETWLLSTSVEASNDADLDRSDETPPTSLSHSAGLETTFDAGADGFEFHPTEPSTDLGFGHDYEGSDLMDALSIPAEELGYSFDSQSYSNEDDHAEYDHGYDEFGII